jgi:hypothetical protein
VCDKIRENWRQELKALKIGREGTGTTDDGMLEQLLGPGKEGKKKKEANQNREAREPWLSQCYGSETRPGT